MHEWMTANPRPDRPQLDVSAMRAAPNHQGYMQDYRSQIGDWRDDMQDWRGDRRDFAQSMHGPVMSGNPLPGQPAPGQPNVQFPLNPQAPQPVPGSGYGFNLADILQRFPNGLRGMNGQPGPNPGY